MWAMSFVSILFLTSQGKRSFHFRSLLPTDSPTTEQQTQPLPPEPASPELRAKNLSPNSSFLSFLLLSIFLLGLLYSQPNTIIEILIAGTREMPPQLEYWLLFQGTWVPFLASTEQLTTVCNSSPRGSVLVRSLFL